MRDIGKLILVITLIIFVCTFLLILIFNSASQDRGLYFEPGNCPKCGQKLIKGIYGHYEPNVCWYCPECP